MPPHPDFPIRRSAWPLTGREPDAEVERFFAEGKQASAHAYIDRDGELCDPHEFVRSLNEGER